MSGRGRRDAMRLIASAAAALQLGGCALFAEDPPATFDLTAPPEAGVPAYASVQLLIPEPAAIRALDTDRILVKPRPGSIAYLAGSQWSDRLPKLVQARLIETLESSGAVKAVGRPGQGLAIDFQLLSEIRAFELDVAGGRKAVVTLSVKLIDDRNGKAVADKVFSAAEPVVSDHPLAVTAALDIAFDRAALEIARWVAGKV